MKKVTFLCKETVAEVVGYPRSPGFYLRINTDVIPLNFSSALCTRLDIGCCCNKDVGVENYSSQTVQSESSNVLVGVNTFSFLYAFSSHLLQGKSLC